MQRIITILLIVVGIIHLLPVTGVFGTEHLSTLYGLSFQESNIAILMRHRAVLFGLLGLFFIYAAFKPLFQPIAFIAGFVSTISFIIIAWSTNGFNNAVHKVVIADQVAVICLLIALIFYVITNRKN